MLNPCQGRGRFRQRCVSVEPPSCSAIPEVQPGAGERTESVLCVLDIRDREFPTTEHRRPGACRNCPAFSRGLSTRKDLGVRFHGYGDAGPDSDYDLMIIVREDAASSLRSEDLAYKALRGTGTAADVVVRGHNAPAPAPRSTPHALRPRICLGCWRLMYSAVSSITRE